MSSRIKEDVHKLFEFWCELKQLRGSSEAPATITECFPDSYCDTQVISKLPEFAFPCEVEKVSVQTYSFVSTSDDSKFRFGFCRHDPKTQTASVLITYLPWHDTFYKLMTVLNELRRCGKAEFQSFLFEAYNKGIPEPGTNLKLFYNAGQNYFLFQRPSQFELPSIPENNNLNLYFNFVDPKNMIAIFSAMLSERRIIFTSQRFDRLSSCIQAASGFLYPMVWQHIFIPILPVKMKDVLCAPMPYLIGVPEAILRTVTAEELGDVVVLNCDNNEFKTPFDDLTQMPPELVSQMKKHLGNTHELIGDRISRIFLRVLVQLIGGYRDAAKYSQGQKITWDRDTFIESRPQQLRNFLTHMMELQIFQQFIDERLDILNSGQGISDEFEMETLRFTDKFGKKRKNYRDFLRNVKDKTNPAVKSAVKSVKEGGRGVKTVYKDLKSKLRDVTPPKAQFHVSTSSPTDFTQCHHSAPNSPISLKRETKVESSVVWKPFTSNTTGSISQIKDILGDRAVESLKHNNNNIILDSFNRSTHKSPAISPTNSACFSDMNISTELQDHPLFKSLNSDKNLKPDSSLDYICQYASPRTGPVINIPTKNGSDINSLANISPSESSLFINDIYKKPETNNDLNEFKIPLKDLSLHFTEKILDTPPDFPAPPIPPKRKNGYSCSLNQPSACSNNQEVMNGNHNVLTDDKVSSTIIIQPNYMKSKTNMLGNAIKTQNLPIPVLRNKSREALDDFAQNTAYSISNALPAKCETTLVRDLIQLEEKTNSYDVSDLDPLNLNAKPIPSFPQALRMSSTSNNLINNPLLPHLIPCYQTAVRENLFGANDIDNELMSQYGLDKFNFTSGNASQKPDQKSAWTKFD